MRGSSVESVLDLQLDTVLTCRRIFPQVFTFGVVQVLAQGWPFLLSPWRQTCSVYGKDVHFGLVILHYVPTCVCTCLIGGCALYASANLERFRRHSYIHFWTSVYLITSFVSVVLIPPNMLANCGMCDISCGISDRISILSQWISWGILGWLSVLRLREAASMAPKTEKIGSISAKVLLITMLLAILADVLGPSWGILANSNPLGVLRRQIVRRPIYFVACLAIAALSGCVAFVFVVSAMASLKEATNLDVDDDSAAQLLQASRQSRRSAMIVTIAGLGSVACLCTLISTDDLSFHLFSVDAVLNSVSCLALTGIWETGLDSSAIIRLGVSLIETRRFRQIEMKLCGVVGNSTGGALVVSTLMRSTHPLEVLSSGMGRFRCIRWEVLLRRPDIIMGGAPLDVLGPGKDELYSLSEPCRLGECDAFISHSWHDSGSGKWQALCCWCEMFKVVHGRFPRLWLDKVCIDQANIDADLQCLPVFLAGCNTLFAMSGSTYNTRLWCVMELLIYRAMLTNDSNRSQPVVWVISKHSDESRDIRESWVGLDARKCDCFKAEDKEQFMRVVRALPGGFDGFNQFLQNIGQTIERDYIEDYEEVLDI